MSANGFRWGFLGFVGIYLCPLIMPVTGAAEELAPDMEFLEFLGQWETTEGDWIDPLALKELEEPESVKDVVNEETIHEH